MSCDRVRGLLSSGARIGGLFLFLILSVRCGGPAPREIERVAVLRFENLTPEASLDWMGRGFAEVLRERLSGSPRIYPIPLHTGDVEAASGPAVPAAVPGIASERQAALLAGANRAVYGQYALVDGVLRVDAEEFDLDRGRVLRAFSESGPASAGMLPLASRLTDAWGPTLRPFPTRSEAALRSYVLAREAVEPADSQRELESAFSADPNFGLPSVMAVELALSRSDDAAAERAITAARSRGTVLDPMDRARLDLDDATLRGDLAARVAALTALSRLAPADARIYADLARALQRRHAFAGAMAAFRQSATIQPQNIDVLNSVGYAAMLNGDLGAATEALRRYAALRPQEPNPLDSLGDVHLYLGRLEDAERFYLEAYQKSPAFLDGAPLLKAVRARLMRGDIAEAGRLFERYRADRTRARDPLLPVRAAEWSWAVGRRRSALDAMQVFAESLASGPLRDVAAESYARLFFWNLELGNRPAARSCAEKVARTAGPAMAGTVRLVQFLAQPDAAAPEWTLRAGRQFPESAASVLKQYALAYALLFAKDFAAAEPVLHSLGNDVEPTADWGLPVLEAWAGIASGRWQNAAALLAHNPIPQVTVLGAFPPLWFPRLFYLRARVLAHQGKPAEAGETYRLFLKLSGPDPEIWGEEQQARLALGTAAAQ